MSTEKFSFGNETCNPHIEVDVFEPVCAHDEIPGSEPLTLEVPVPTFVPIVPPPECTCLTFQQSDSISMISMTMRRRSTITDESPLKNTAKTTIKAKGDCCDGTYDIGTEIHFEVPECLHADGLIDSKTYNFSDDPASGISGSITVETWMQDCVPVLKVTGEPLRVNVDPPIISIPPLCINPADITVKPQYYTRDEDGDLILNTQEEGTTVHMSVTDGVGGCKQLSFSNGEDGAVTLDLTGLSTFGNGGSVFQADDLNLYTDGSEGDGDTWHGGGLGDRGNNNGEQYVERRGPKMRGEDSPWGSGVDYFVPRAVYKDQNDTSKLTITSGSKTATEWRSSRRLGEDEEAEESGIATGNLSMVLPAGLQWHERGIALTLSHFIWNPSGLLSSMNETGVGALVSPAPTVFADGAKRSTSNSGTRDVSGRNASGLRINPPVTPTSGNSWYGFEGGLDVYDGDGLRVFGADYKTTAAEIGDTTTAPDSRFGRLEVMYGPGFRVRAANSGTTPQYRDKPVDEDGALVPNEGRGLRVHGVTKMGSDSTDAAHKNKLEVFGHSGDFKFNHDGKMVINDEKSTTDVVLPKLTTLGSQCRATGDDKFTRNGDRTLRLCLIQPKRGSDNDKYWGLSGCAGDWIKKPVFPEHDVGTKPSFTFRAAGDVKSRIATLLSAIGNPSATNWDRVVANCTASHDTPSGFTVAKVDDDNTRNQLLVLAWEISTLAQAVLDIQSWLANCLTYAYIHIGKAGTVLAINGDDSAPDVTDRHYQASEPQAGTSS